MRWRPLRSALPSRPTRYTTSQTGRQSTGPIEGGHMVAAAPPLSEARASGGWPRLSARWPQTTAVQRPGIDSPTRGFSSSATSSARRIRCWRRWIPTLPWTSTTWVSCARLPRQCVTWPFSCWPSTIQIKLGSGRRSGRRVSVKRTRIRRSAGLPVTTVVTSSSRPYAPSGPTLPTFDTLDTFAQQFARAGAGLLRYGREIRGRLKGRASTAPRTARARCGGTSGHL